MLTFFSKILPLILSVTHMSLEETRSHIMLGAVSPWYVGNTHQPACLGSDVQCACCPGQWVPVLSLTLVSVLREEFSSLLSNRHQTFGQHGLSVGSQPIRLMGCILFPALLLFHFCSIGRFITFLSPAMFFLILFLYAIHHLGVVHWLFKSLALWWLPGVW